MVNTHQHYTSLEPLPGLLETFRRNWLISSFGIVLFFCGVNLIFWNEEQSVRHALSLDEALESVISVDITYNHRQLNEGRLVHVVGPIMTAEPLTEPDYNIQVQAVKLKRRVQMYQWIEESSSANVFNEEQQNYYYTAEWKDRIVDSSFFYMRHGHENPQQFPIESRVQIADHVTIGTYELGPEIKDRFGKFIDITSDTRPDDAGVKLHSGMYYHCNDVFNPEVGDIRLLFSVAGIEGNRYTIIGKYHDGLVRPYVSSSNTKVLVIMPGEHSITQAIEATHYKNKLQAWAVRFIGWVLLFFATTCLTSLIYCAVGQHRYLYRFSPDPADPLKGTVLLSMSLTLIIIAIAWIFLRPWLSIGIFCAAFSPFLFCARRLYQHYPHID